MFDKEHCTPLIKASQREFSSCVDTLLGHGADPNEADIYGNTALHYTVLNDDLEVAGLLLAYDANIEAKAKEGFTPYLLALQENKGLIAEFLEDMGADIHAEELLDRKHRKIHHRKMCKHTARRPACRNERACPLEKGNKSEVTKSQLRELVRTPAVETSTAEVDTLMEIHGLPTSDSTVGIENQYKVFPYRILMEVNNSENDVTVIEIEEMKNPKVFLQENPKLETTHNKYIIRSECPCPLADERKSENSKFSMSESISVLTREGSPVEMDSVPQVGGIPVPGYQHHTARRCCSRSSEVF